MSNKAEAEIFSDGFIGESYTKITHPSGCRIYVFPKKLSSTYAIFGSLYGSINNIFKTDGDEDFTEVPDGIAHFLEHKLFANSDGTDSFERFSEYGADANAYTSFNKTAYLFSCTDRFEESLSELIEFVTHPYFTESSVSSEVGIISEEIRMYDDNPQDRCFYGMLEGMYHSHSIKRNICGSVESISKITPDLLYRCYELFYQPSNLVLIICGDVDAKTVSDIAWKHLPSEHVRREIQTFNENKNEPKDVYCPLKHQKMQVAKPIFNIGFKDTAIPSSPQERLRKDAAMSILNEMIFSTSGELYDRLLSSGMISPMFSYGYTITESFAYNSVASESDDPKAVLEAILEHIEKLKHDGLSYDAFLRGRKVMLADFIKNFDSTENIANNLFSFVCDGCDMDFLTFANTISSICFEEVKELFGKVFSKDYLTLSIVCPLDEEGQEEK